MALASSVLSSHLAAQLGELGVTTSGSAAAGLLLETDDAPESGDGGGGGAGARPTPPRHPAYGGVGKSGSCDSPLLRSAAAAASSGAHESSASAASSSGIAMPRSAQLALLRLAQRYVGEGKPALASGILAALGLGDGSEADDEEDDNIIAAGGSGERASGRSSGPPSAKHPRTLPSAGAAAAAAPAGSSAPTVSHMSRWTQSLERRQSSSSGGAAAVPQAAASAEYMSESTASVTAAGSHREPGAPVLPAALPLAAASFKASYQYQASIEASCAGSGFAASPGPNQPFQQQHSYRTSSGAFSSLGGRAQEFPGANNHSGSAASGYRPGISSGAGAFSQSTPQSQHPSFPARGCAPPNFPSSQPHLYHTQHQYQQHQQYPQQQQSVTFQMQGSGSVDGRLRPPLMGGARLLPVVYFPLQPRHAVASGAAAVGCGGGDGSSESAWASSSRSGSGAHSWSTVTLSETPSLTHARVLLPPCPVTGAPKQRHPPQSLPPWQPGPAPSGPRTASVASSKSGSREGLRSSLSDTALAFFASHPQPSPEEAAMAGLPPPPPLWRWPEPKLLPAVTVATVTSGPQAGSGVATAAAFDGAGKARATVGLLPVQVESALIPGLLDADDPWQQADVAQVPAPGNQHIREAAWLRLQEQGDLVSLDLAHDHAHGSGVGLDIGWM